MYHEILVAAAIQQQDEFTSHALAVRDVAVALAKCSGARLSVLSVYDYGDIKEPPLAADMAARYREDMMQRIDGAMETKTKEFIARLQQTDLEIIPVVRVGEPRKTIIEMVEQLPADVLVIGAHSKRSVLDVVLGGTAGYLSRHAPCSVIMVTPQRPA
jgi:nucleotide-binding universal stress UspA family protein